MFTVLALDRREAVLTLLLEAEEAPLSGISTAKEFTLGLVAIYLLYIIKK